MLTKHDSVTFKTTLARFRYSLFDEIPITALNGVSLDFDHLTNKALMMAVKLPLAVSHVL